MWHRAMRKFTENLGKVDISHLHRWDTKDPPTRWVKILEHTTANRKQWYCCPLLWNHDYCKMCIRAARSNHVRWILANSLLSFCFHKSTCCPLFIFIRPLATCNSMRMATASWAFPLAQRWWWWAPQSNQIQCFSYLSSTTQHHTKHG